MGTRGWRLLTANILVAALPLGLGLLLLASGAPMTSPDVERLVASVREASLAETILWFLLIALLAFLSQPLQRPLVRVLEGYWDGSAAGRALGALGVRRHRRHLRRLIDIAYGQANGYRRTALRRLARRRLTTDYPSQERLLPTRLGNALRAFEDEAGQRYGLDTITMLPRLYPYLSSQVSGALDDLRDQLDIAARLCVTLLLASLISASLLFTHGWWLLLPAATTVLAWVAYRSAVQAAVAYGKQVAVAFDLHRFDMLRGLHFPLLPADREWQFNKQVSDFFLNRLSLSPDDPPDDYPDYQHPDELLILTPTPVEPADGASAASRSSLLSPVT